MKQLIRSIDSYNVNVYNNKDTEDLPIFIVWQGKIYGTSEKTAKVAGPVIDIFSNIKQGHRYTIKENSEEQSDNEVRDINAEGYYKNGQIKTIRIQEVK